MTTTFQLIAQSGPTAGNIYPLEQEEIFIGRDLNNDIVINDPEVSRRHIRFFKQGDDYNIEDLGSTNGTLVNGQRIEGAHTLNSGEEITLGEHVHLIYERISDGHTDETVLSAKPVDTDKTFAAKPDKKYDIEHELFTAAEPEVKKEQQYPSPKYAGQVPGQPQRAVAGAAGKKKLPGWAIAVGIIILLVICACSITAFFMPAEWWCAIDLFGIFQGCPQ